MSCIACFRHDVVAAVTIRKRDSVAVKLICNLFENGRFLQMTTQSLRRPGTYHKTCWLTINTHAKGAGAAKKAANIKSINILECPEISHPFTIIKKHVREERSP